MFAKLQARYGECPFCYATAGRDAFAGIAASCGGDGEDKLTAAWTLAEARRRRVDSQFLVPSPDDFDVQRADRSLGLRRAARFYNELVAPGIGGASRVRHLSWAVAGLYLHGQVGGKFSAVTLAHAVEALGSKVQWAMLPPEQQSQPNGLRGRRAFARHPDAWTFRELCQRRYYVQVTHRQHMTRALPPDTGLGLAWGSSRFNGMALTEIGKHLAEALLTQRGVGQGSPALLQNLKAWMQGTLMLEPKRERLAALLGPRSPTDEERVIVRGRLHSDSSGAVGNDSQRRSRLIRFLQSRGIDRLAQQHDTDSLLPRLAEFPGGAAHAHDIRTALAFEDLRLAGVGVLDAVVARLQQAGTKLAVARCAAEPSVRAAILAHRSAVAKYQAAVDAGKNGHADVRRFAEETKHSDVETLTALVHRDGRMLEVCGDAIWRGPVFPVDEPQSAGRATAQLTEQATDGAEDDRDLSGRPVRLYQFIELWRDCRG